jgi:DNA-binding CsgD family transcriptional regulator
MMPQGIPNPDTWPRDLLVLYSTNTLNLFIDHAFRMLPRVVDCDYVSAIYRRSGDSFLKERDSRGRVWSRAFLRRYVELTPAIPFVTANPGVKILATRFAMPGTDAELRPTAFYREVMQPQGWRHAAVLCFWAEPAQSFPIFVMSLYRAEGRPDFSDQDLAMLGDLHPFLAAAVTRFHQMSSSNAVSDGVATALRRVADGVVVLNWRLQIVRANLAGRRACASWNQVCGGFPKSRGAVKLPADLLQVCEELRQELQSAIRMHPDSPAQRRRRVSSAGAAGLAASVTAICQAGAMAEPSFLIEFQEAIRAPAGSAGNEGLLTCLTGSEREVALVVAEGVSNDEAAERLGKTVHAVKFLLHRIYSKLAVPNRARLSLLLSRPHEP